MAGHLERSHDEGPRFGGNAMRSALKWDVGQAEVIKKIVYISAVCNYKLVLYF